MIWKRYHNRFIVEQTPLLNKQIKLEHIVPNTPYIAPSSIYSKTYTSFSFSLSLSFSLTIYQIRSLTININSRELDMLSFEWQKDFRHPKWTGQLMASLSKFMKQVYYGPYWPYTASRPMILESTDIFMPQMVSIFVSHNFLFVWLIGHLQQSNTRHQKTDQQYIYWTVNVRHFSVSTRDKLL